MSEKANGEAAKRFLGAWRYVGAANDGRPRTDLGADPKGIICYHASGHMAVQVAPDRERARAGAKPTPEEAQAALADYIAYFGTYTVDEQARTVTHHRQGSVQPNDTADLVRGYEFAGERLILRPPGTTYEVIWERFK